MVATKETSDTSIILQERIKTLAKAKCGGTTKMLLDLGLSKNTISSLVNGTQISYITLLKIANYLDCSIDYLLGRTNYPQIVPVGLTLDVLDNQNRVELSKNENGLIESYRKLKLKDKLKTAADILELLEKY